jgi:hypothetical protein
MNGWMEGVKEGGSEGERERGGRIAAGEQEGCRQAARDGRMDVWRDGKSVAKA